MSSNSKPGYKNPPGNTRFTKGTSGNPSGRPKRSPNVSSVIAHSLNKPLTVIVNGKRKQMPWIEALVRHLKKRALEDDKTAFKLLELGQKAAEWKEEHGDDHVPYIIRLIGSDADL
jgi:Family of unknown function (DUF5681)